MYPLFICILKPKHGKYVRLGLYKLEFHVLPQRYTVTKPTKTSESELKKKTKPTRNNTKPTNQQTPNNPHRKTTEIAPLNNSKGI